MVPLSFAPPFEFNREEFALVEGRALYWPRERALLVADLHLEKASFYAQHGQMLPPYDSRETLGRIALAIRETGARRVFTLGDNFHDSSGTGLADRQRQSLERLAAVIGRQELAVLGKEARLLEMQVGDQQRPLARPVQRAACGQAEFLATEIERERNGNHAPPLPRSVRFGKGTARLEPRQCDEPS